MSGDWAYGRYNGAYILTPKSGEPITESFKNRSVLISDSQTNRDPLGGDVWYDARI
jgi:hypothetical protein